MRRPELKTRFMEDLIRVNRVDGFRRLLFFPGMLFDRNETWWPGGGLRSCSHEGLDLCFFESDDQAFRLDERILIPAACTGRVVGLLDDFLGKTIVTEHKPDPGDSAPVYLFYAHILPQPDLGIGDMLNAGECFARIAPVCPKKTKLPAHLHLTIGLADKLPPVHEMTWPLLNRVDRRFFLDPLPTLDSPYRIIPFCPGTLSFNDFQSWRKSSAE